MTRPSSRPMCTRAGPTTTPPAGSARKAPACTPTAGRRTACGMNRPESVTDDRSWTFTCDFDFFWCVDGRFLLGSNETGTANEVYSDIVGESVGFFHERNGATADYLQAATRARPDRRLPRAPRSASAPTVVRGVDGQPAAAPSSPQSAEELAAETDDVVRMAVTRHERWTWTSSGGAPAPRRRDRGQARSVGRGGVAGKADRLRDFRPGSRLAPSRTVPTTRGWPGP